MVNENKKSVFHFTVGTRVICGIEGLTTDTRFKYMKLIESPKEKSQPSTVARVCAVVYGREKKKLQKMTRQKKKARRALYDIM